MLYVLNDCGGHSRLLVPAFRAFLLFLLHSIVRKNILCNMFPNKRMKGEESLREEKFLPFESNFVCGFLLRSLRPHCRYSKRPKRAATVRSRHDLGREFDFHISSPIFRPSCATPSTAGAVMYFEKGSRSYLRTSRLTTTYYHSVARLYRRLKINPQESEKRTRYDNVSWYICT